MDEETFSAELDPVLAAVGERRAGCPAVERLSAHAHGELSGEELAAVEEHRRRCPLCARELDLLAAGPVPVDEVTWKRAERALDGRPAPWRRAAGRSAGRRAGVIAAAAAALVVGVALWQGRQPPPPAGPVSVTRGSGLQPLQPSGSVHDVERFEWSAPPIAARFLVEVRQGEEVVYRGESTVSALSLPREVRGRLEAGSAYRWRVQALAPEGRVFLESAWVDFRLMP
jgi:hypothetical protein